MAKMRGYLLLLNIVICLNSMAINWNPVCPDSIVATNVCFGIGLNNTIICSPGGMYLYEDDMEWHFYTNGYLPVIEAIHYNFEKALVIMGDGSYSDGIYTFDLQTKEFEIVDWYYKPSFLRYYEYNDVYYLGLEEGGLYISVNGISWNDISYFDTVQCNDIAFYEEHIVVSEGTNQFDNIHYSNNAGTTWYSESNGSGISKMEFDGFGKLFGIKPSAGSSSGVYKSLDYGYFWDAMNWEFNISTLACDALGNVVVGWENGYGIAMLDPDVIYPEFVFLNEGLPDTHVNNIKVNPAMSSITIFVCTNSGAYSSHDYFVDIENHTKSCAIEIFTNPARKNNPLSIKIPQHQKNTALRIYNCSGKISGNFKLVEGLNSINISALQPGTYICSFISETTKTTQKLIVID